MSGRGQVKIQTMYLCKKADGKSGLYIAEGHCAGRGVRRILHPRTDTAMAVLCQGEKAAFQDVLRQMEQWFYNEFPQMVHPFSASVVERYWLSILKLQPLEKSEISILLVHRGQYVFCGVGDFRVYEYFPDSGKWRRWHTCAERKELDKELGLCNCAQQRTTVFFRHRKISENTFFFLLPGLVSLDNSENMNKGISFKKMMSYLAEQVSCVAGIRYQT